MRRLIWFLQFLLAVIASLPFALLPAGLSLRLGGLCGSLLFHIWRDRRKIAVDNISSAISRNAIITDRRPEEIIRQHFVNLGRSFAEIIKICFGRGENILKGIEVRGVDNFRKASEKGAGVIFITGHCGNWELLGLSFSRMVSPMHFVARRQNNPYLNRAIERMRETFGNKTLYKKGALKKILLALKSNEPVGVLIDQSVVRSEGIVTDFLKKKAYTMKMPAVLAHKTGSPVLPLFIRRTSGGHVIEIGGEIALDTSDDPKTAIMNDTVKFTGYIEEYIRKYPEEWLWIHRKWKRISE